jgi:HlyD family secretion protein
VQIVAVLVGLGILAGTGVPVYQYATRNPNEGVEFFAVAQGPLTIDVTLNGAIKNRDQVIIKNQVEGKTTILWIITEGNQVQKDDLLLELDSAAMTDKKKQQDITVINCEAAFIAAREALAITQSQSESDIKKAELDNFFAEMDLKKYEEGDYKQQIQQAQSDLTMADETLTKADETLRWSKQLNKEGYLTSSELQTDQLAADQAKLNLELAKSKLYLLKEYQNKRDLKQYQSNVEQTAMALERVKRQAAANIVQAEASLKAKKGEYDRQLELQKKIEDQIAKCTVRAPVAGMAVYSTTGKMSRWGNNQPLQEGLDVWERQELIYLPTTSSMMAEVKIPESSLRKVHVGLPARISVDAVPGRTFRGRVAKIGLLPDADSMFMNPDLKQYATQVYLEEEGVDLRAGMGCKVEIVVEEYDEATYVQVQAITRVGDRYFAHVLTPTGPQDREVQVGLDNNRMIRIVGGLAKGDKVMQTPPLSNSAQPAAGATSRPAPLTQPAELAASQPSDEKPLDMAALAKMTPEERKKFMDSLPADQKEQLKGLRPRRGGADGARREGGAPREDRPPAP